MVLAIIEHSQDQPEIRMGREVQQATDALRSFLFERVYIGSLAKKEEQKARGIIKMLYQYYVQDPSALPEDQRKQIAEEGVERCVVDYVAGMTDHFAIKMFEILFYTLLLAHSPKDNSRFEVRGSKEKVGVDDGGPGACGFHRDGAEQD